MRIDVWIFTSYDRFHRSHRRHSHRRCSFPLRYFTRKMSALFKKRMTLFTLKSTSTTSATRTRVLANDERKAKRRKYRSQFYAFSSKKTRSFVETNDFSATIPSSASRNGVTAFIKTNGRGELMRTSAHPTLASFSIQPMDSFGIWAILLASSHFGLWAETKPWGASLGGACLISALTTLILANIGILPHASPTYDQINHIILPLAVPLLLFSANLNVVFKSTGRLVPLFCFGSIGTLLGGVVGYMLVPLLSLGDEAWKVCAALTSRHIGGAVNYVAVANVLNVSPKVLGAGLAADNLCNVLYFALLFYLARDVEYVKDGEEEKSTSISSRVVVVKIVVVRVVRIVIRRRRRLQKKRLTRLQRRTLPVKVSAPTTPPRRSRIPRRPATSPNRYRRSSTARRRSPSRSRPSFLF